MKRIGYLFDAITDRTNLRLAFSKAIRGKRWLPSVQRFTAQLEDELCLLSEQMRAGHIETGRFCQFVIYDPKERVITAPCFRERVLHHAIMNVCEPHFDRWLIGETYACRVGKGRIKALLRAREYAHEHSWFLKFDIRKYFDSISHERLIDQLHRRFKDPRLLALFEQIINSFRGALGRGLPIGSLTSQHFANFYMSRCDRFAKETLRIPGYVRYMDDVALWGSHEQVRSALPRIADFLREELELEFKPQPYMNHTWHGMDFLGCRVFPHHMVLNRRSRLRYRRGIHNLETLYIVGQISELELQQRATALTAFTQTEGVSSWKYRGSVISMIDGE